MTDAEARRDKMKRSVLLKGWKEWAVLIAIAFAADYVSRHTTQEHMFAMTLVAFAFILIQLHRIEERQIEIELRTEQMRELAETVRRIDKEV